MLLRFDPWRDFDRLSRQMWDDSFAGRHAPMDLYRSGDHYVLHLDLPGVDPASVDLSVTDGVLTIRAAREPRTTDDVQVLLAERPTGEFVRTLSLGRGLDLENIAATYDAGVLTVTIPVAETAKPRRIPIGSAAGDAASDRDRVIEGETAEQAAVGAG